MTNGPVLFRGLRQDDSDLLSVEDTVEIRLDHGEGRGHLGRDGDASRRSVGAIRRDGADVDIVRREGRQLVNGEGERVLRQNRRLRSDDLRLRDALRVDKLLDGVESDFVADRVEANRLLPGQRHRVGADRVGPKFGGHVFRFDRHRHLVRQTAVAGFGASRHRHGVLRIALQVGQLARARHWHRFLLPFVQVVHGRHRVENGVADDFSAPGNRLPPHFHRGEGRGHGSDAHRRPDDVALRAEEDAVAERARSFIGPRVDSEFVVHVLLQRCENGLADRAGNVTLRHDAVVHFLVELDEVTGDAAVAVFQSRNVPADDDHVGRLEAVRDVGGRARWSALGRRQNLHRFLAEANVIAAGYAEFILQTTFQSFNQPVLNLRPVKGHFNHIGVGRHAGHVLGSVTQSVAFEFAVGLRRSTPNDFHAHRWFFFDNLEIDGRAIGHASRGSDLLGWGSCSVTLAGQSGHLNGVGRIRLEPSNRVLFDDAHVIAQRLANDRFLKSR